MIPLLVAFLIRWHLAEGKKQSSKGQDSSHGAAESRKG